MFRNIKYYFQYSILFLILPLVVIYKELSGVNWKDKFCDAYHSLFEYREQFEQHKKNLKEK